MEIVGLEDKKQITALLTCSMSGELLPPQLLYQGKTQQCTPTSCGFPRFIPGGCTGNVQPLDISGNSQFKDLLLYTMN